MSMAAVGLGDLLRVLEHLPVSQWAAARTLGFPVAEQVSEDAEALMPLSDRDAGASETESEDDTPDAPASDDSETGTTASPAQAIFWRVTAQRTDPQTGQEVPAWLTAAGTPNAKTFERDPEAPRPPAPAPLVPAARMAVLLRRELGAARPAGGPDVPAVVRSIVRARPLTRWPRALRDGWPGRVVLVMDVRQGLRPLDADLRDIARQVQGLLGARVVGRICRGGPWGWRDFEGEPASLPVDGSLVLVLGDVGMHQPDGVEHERWCALGQRLARAGRRALVLAPTAGQRVTRMAASCFDVVALDDRVPVLRRVRADGVGNRGATLPEVGALRAALFGNSFVTPTLLRELRRVLAGRGHTLDVDSETALWRDSAVSAYRSVACTLALAQRDEVLRGYRALSPGCREAVAAVHWRHLRAESPLVRAEYARWVQPLVPPGSAMARTLMEGVADGERLMQQACAALRGSDARLVADLSAGMARFGRRSLAQVQAGSAAMQGAWALAHREALGSGRVAWPAGVDAAALQWVFGDAPQAETLVLGLQGMTLSVTRESAVPAGAHRLAEFSGAAFWRTRAVEADWQCLRPGEAVLLAAERQEVACGGTLVEMEAFTRPEWAESVWFDLGEWHARPAQGRELIWTPARWGRMTGRNSKHGSADGVLWGVTKGCWWDPENRHLWRTATQPAWASRKGSDAIGSWVEFTVEGRRGPVTQRLRWIAPGEFLMGSPDTEKGRFNDEHQHPVLLTQGYWLADTACTQALWEAVMCENPSRFKDDPRNPVEQVGWNDITQEFLPRLNKLVSGLNLTLPTEAQWEYACRAGTQTRYSFGDEINQGQVNFGAKRGKTVPVKELLANPWGLYQMHGNVWEWCLDELAAYPEGTVIDPVVHQDKKEEGRQRVLRGGSWIGNGRRCRSAFRRAFVPDERSYYFGFRLARGLANHSDQPTPPTP
jgi:formylglycine-generating enzyme required for sulfatase activity